MSHFLRRLKPVGLCVSLVLLQLLCTAACTTKPPGGETESTTAPSLESIRMVTFSSEDARRSAARYVEQLGYRQVEDGEISAQLAQRWQAPAVAGRPYVLLQSPDGERSYLRFVQVAAPADYRAMTTAGWNAAELLVRDPYEVHEALSDSEFRHIGGPAPLGMASSIHAVQYLGPDKEVIYLTADLGETAGSTLARTEALVGRPFIMVLAGESVDAMSSFYQSAFAVRETLRVETPIGVVSRAQQRPPEQLYDLGLLRLADFSHSIELDAYPQAPAREALPGELPPGIALVSFCVTEFSEVARSRFIAEPARPPGLAYAGGETAVMRGPAGELVELIICE